MTKRILVVEDQADNMQILRDLLTSAGYELIEAKDGEEGVKVATAERPDLILMDIQLPLLDGYEATRRIKSDPALRAIPIIVITSAETALSLLSLAMAHPPAALRSLGGIRLR